MAIKEIHTATRPDWPLLAALVLCIVLALIAGIAGTHLGLDTGYYPDL